MLMALRSVLISAIFTVFTSSVFLSHHASGSSGICSIVATPNGYKCQEHEVKTGDGYILSVQRIPEGRNGGSGSNRHPVLLQHGILVDGLTWMLNSPEQSLAFILADNGFDVWISSFRGTRYSKRHVTLNAHHSKYWDWSWDELAGQDVPSVIDFVVQQTGQKPHYVGHSMGTLVALVSLSNGGFKNVKSAALLSPVAHLSHMKAPLANAAAKLFVGEGLKILGFAEFDPRGKKVADFLAIACSFPGVHCFDMVTAVSGPNCCLNRTSDSFVIKHQPQSTSVKNLVHFAQIARSGVIAKYDYGNPLSNLKHYKRVKPPVYDLSKIPQDFPIFLTHGGKDPISNNDDVATLIRIMKSHNKDKLQVQSIPDYAHLDFIMAVNANKVLYGQVIDFFKSHA